MNVLCFVFSAWWYGHAYIDLDGCLILRMKVPDSVPAYARLEWWKWSLSARPVVKRRLLLLYVLRILCGVRLYIWTNRSPEHAFITRKSLGWHMWLFSGGFYCGGTKDMHKLFGPCMDDQSKYIVCGQGFSLLVKQL